MHIKTSEWSRTWSRLPATTTCSSGIRAERQPQRVYCRALWSLFTDASNSPFNNRSSRTSVCLLLLMLMAHIVDCNAVRLQRAQIIISEAGNSSGAECKPIDLLENGCLSHSSAEMKWC